MYVGGWQLVAEGRMGQLQQAVAGACTVLLATTIRGIHSFALCAGAEHPGGVASGGGVAGPVAGPGNGTEHEHEPLLGDWILQWDTVLCWPHELG